jgi:hypothetical protein
MAFPATNVIASIQEQEKTLGPKNLLFAIPVI